MKLVILHTNDLHGHLTPWQGWDGDLKGKRIGGLGVLGGAIAAQRRDAGGSCLLLDAGDLIGDTMIADLTQGKALITSLNHLAYDAMTIGNHEPDFGMERLKERISEAAFPVLAANLVDADSGTLFAKPYVIKTVGHVRVGILGLAYPKTARTTAAKNVGTVAFQKPEPAVEEFLPQLRHDGAEIVVVLSHLGLAADQSLARSIKGIDVIVGGHSHNRMKSAERVGDTLIVQAGAHGSDLGRLDLDIRGGKIADYNRTLIALDHSAVPTDESAAQLAAKLLDEHRSALDEVIGHTDDWLVRAQTLAGQEARQRDEESTVDSLFADFLRVQTNADIAMLPGVGYGVAIAPGPVTAAQLRQLIPHDGKVTTMRLPGSRIIGILEQAVENVFGNPDAKVGGMIQVSGLRFRYDTTRPKGHRIIRVERSECEWNPADDFKVVTNSMLAAGGHNQDEFQHGDAKEVLSSQFEMIKDAFRGKSPVKTSPKGRIKHQDDPAD